MKPIIAIVGRPNVGKSMLFNKLVGRRLSIVQDTPGVTRDRIYGESEWCGRKFTLIDTGGIEPRTDNQILRVNMANIRRKLERDPGQPEYIFTEVGVGYRMREGD